MNSDKPIIKGEIILIPNSIKQGIIRNNLTYDDFLNLTKIREIFSLEDLKYVYDLNSNINKILNIKTKNVNIPNYLDLYWNNNNIYEQLLSVVNLKFDSLIERITDSNVITSNLEPFEIINTHTTVVICVINSQFVDGGKIKEEFSSKLIREFLKLLYGYNSYSVLSRHQLFQVYLDNLKQN